ncbi:MAG TPA: winged helix-turn-helix transcriptional regulator [Actinopolymorphaceae bacterium]
MADETRHADEPCAAADGTDRSPAATCAEENPLGCLAREILDRIGDKWSLMVIAQIGDRTRRFTELRREIPPISQRMLTVTLRALERDGLVRRTVHPVVPPRVDYALTQLGRTLLDLSLSLVQWAMSHADEIARAREAYEARQEAERRPFTLEAADRLAERLHAHQVDKAGRPYIEHPRAVARLTRHFGGSEEQQIAALLHDTVEDTDCTLDDLRDAGVPDAVVVLVDALTRRPGESDDDYLARVIATPGAALVKRADVAHNAAPERLGRRDPPVRERLRRKYARTIERLDAGALAHLT